MFNTEAVGWAPAEENVRVVLKQATCGERCDYVGFSDSSQPCSGDVLNEMPRGIADFPLADASFLSLSKGVLRGLKTLQSSGRITSEQWGGKHTISMPFALVLWRV